MNNSEKISLLKDMEDNKTNSINLKQRLCETEVNLLVKTNDNINLSDQIEQLKTKFQDDFLFVHKSIELFKIDNFVREADENIKMYILGMNNWPLKSVLEENILRPDCSNAF